MPVTRGYEAKRVVVRRGADGCEVSFGGVLDERKQPTRLLVFALDADVASVQYQGVRRPVEQAVTQVELRRRSIRVELVPGAGFVDRPGQPPHGDHDVPSLYLTFRLSDARFEALLATLREEIFRAHADRFVLGAHAF